ncbi:diphthamide biosynthesis protein [Holotrichia oblita]|uniref:Diphthamide biosynthesis protein n=1 Tax=Holotrichia oblita TaxID=644536 RepID=A0ACB9SHF9_HOLOL|nr:diphthamide biosynthesis protein [Holotrichia oblita]
MDQFSSNPSVTLEKAVDTSEAPTPTNSADIDRVYELDRCIEWIKTNQYKNVCLQFPDYLLPDSSEIAFRLQKRLGQVVYIMGDSAYESCCVDYITARHVNADAIIHFGPRCLSSWTNLIPCLCIYDKNPIDADSFKNLFKKKFYDDDEKIDLILDTPYIHLKDMVADLFSDNINVTVSNIDANCFNVQNTLLYIGKNDRKFLNFRLKHKNITTLYYYDPQESDPLIKNYEENNAILKRRRYLVEKIKESETFAIVIATVVIENYMKAIDRIKNLLKLNGKKYYIISVGRPTVAKLANFPEMDVYVLICCSMSDIFESRDFYKPFVTPFDIEIALNPKSIDSNFTYDLNADYLQQEIDENIEHKPDVSLITGNLRYKDIEDKSDSSSKEVALRSDGTIAVSDKSGAGFLATRTFKGLEQKLGQTEVKLATDGKKGIPQQYENELY